MAFLFGKKDREQPKTEEPDMRPTKRILVLDSNRRDWLPVFAQATAGMYALEVKQAAWGDISLTAYSDGKCIVQTRDGTSFQPDMLLVRSLVRGLTPDKDFRNLLFGFKYSHIPSVNSLESIYNCLDRPWVHAALDDVRRRIGDDAFPLIRQNFHPIPGKGMHFPPDFPVVVKVGHAEAGYGKMRLGNQGDLNDFAGVLAMHQDYATVEPLVEGRSYDLRIQKIGAHYRAYKRESSNWKGNVGTSIVTEIEMTETFQRWADEAASLFGGMDILTVDAIHTEDGRDVILEINDTASGLAAENEAEDMGLIAALTIQRLEEHFAE